LVEVLQEGDVSAQELLLVVQKGSTGLTDNELEEHFEPVAVHYDQVMLALIYGGVLLSTGFMERRNCTTGNILVLQSNGDSRIYDLPVSYRCWIRIQSSQYGDIQEIEESAH
jgi:hypothetical protein